MRLFRVELSDKFRHNQRGRWGRITGSHNFNYSLIFIAGAIAVWAQLVAIFDVFGVAEARGHVQWNV